MEETTNKSGVSAGMVTIIVIIVAIIFGGGAYAYVNNKATKEKKDLNAQITQLQSQVAASETTATTTTTTPSSTTSATTTADVTASWKTYANTKYGFSFKYPDSWTSGAQSNNANNIYFGTSGGDSTIPNSGDFMVAIGSSVAPTNPTNYSVGGVSAYKAPIPTGPNGGAASIYFSHDSINFSLTMQTYGKPDNITILDKIVSTFQFTK